MDEVEIRIPEPEDSGAPAAEIAVEGTQPAEAVVDTALGEAAAEAGAEAAPAEVTAPEPATEPHSGENATAGTPPAPEELATEAAPALEADAEAVALKPVIEAIVYIAEEPVTAAQIAAVLERPPATIERLMAELIAEYSAPARGLMIREVAGGYKMATKPEHHDVMRRFVKSLKPPLKLSLAALETLATIAYKQPITAPEIMAIRGVQGAGVLKTLLDRKLIVAAGRKNVVGRPVLYKTSKEFLVQFGLKDLSELPTLKEFEELRRLSIADEPEEKGTEEKGTDAFSGATPAGSAPGPGAVPEEGGPDGPGSPAAGAAEPAGETAAGPEAAAHEHDLPAGPATERTAEAGAEPDAEGSGASGSQTAGAAESAGETPVALEAAANGTAEPGVEPDAEGSSASGSQTASAAESAGETAAGPATESAAEPAAAPDSQTAAGAEDGTEQETAAEPSAQTGENA